MWFVVEAICQATSATTTTAENMGFLLPGGSMCYSDSLQNRGLNFKITDCFNIVGFDWTDKEFIEAVKNKDARIFEILEWAAFGGAEDLDFASSLLIKESDLYQAKNILEGYDRNKLRNALKNNKHLEEEQRKLIERFLDGTLEEAAREQRINQNEIFSKLKFPVPGFVYLIKLDNGLCKIGKAKSIKERMKVFGVQFPIKWELIHYFHSDNYSKAEEELHADFASKREIGEFFRLTEDDIIRIQSIRDGEL